MNFLTGALTIQERGGEKMIGRSKRNIGKTVVYIPPHPRTGRTTKITGFRGDWWKRGRKVIPYVTLTDGNTVAGHLIKKI